MAAYREDDNDSQSSPDPIDFLPGHYAESEFEYAGSDVDAGYVVSEFGYATSAVAASTVPSRTSSRISTPRHTPALLSRHPSPGSHRGDPGEASNHESGSRHTSPSAENTQEFVSVARHEALERKVDTVITQLHELLRRFESGPTPQSRSNPQPTQPTRSHPDPQPAQSQPDPQPAQPTQSSARQPPPAGGARVPPTHTKRNSTQKNILAARVRAVLHGRHGLIPREQLLRVTVSDADRVAFATRLANDPRSEATDTTNFRIDLKAGSDSPWNVSALRIFRTRFYQSTGINASARMDEALRKAFAKHLRYLRYQLQLHESDLAGRSSPAARKKKSRVTTRVNTTFQNRILTAQSNSLLAQFVPMLETLGTEGTSSDESDYEDPKNVKYYRHSVPFLSDECVLWKHCFDSVAATQGPATNVPRRGNPPRVREPAHGRPSRRVIFKPGLPSNAYNPEWLARHPIDASRLRPTGIYNFTFPAAAFGL